MSKIVHLSHGLPRIRLHILAEFWHLRAGCPPSGTQTMGQGFLALNFLPGQFIHQTKALALQIEKWHVTKPLPVNLAISQNDLWLDFFSALPGKKVARRARSALRATFQLFYAPQRAISLIIHELSCKKFHFFSFLLTFGEWNGDHYGQNFMENNSVENFKA